MTVRYGRSASARRRSHSEVRRERPDRGRVLVALALVLRPRPVTVAVAVAVAVAVVAFRRVPPALRGGPSRAVHPRPQRRELGRAHELVQRVHLDPSPLLVRARADARVARRRSLERV
eukprot:17637-Pelagococcus_subviridis.AAC.1